MKKLLGILVLGLLIFANEAKSEIIELKSCFKASYTKWHPTKFYDLRDRLENVTWSINVSTGLITHIEIFKQSYVDKYNKNNAGVFTMSKEEFREFELVNYTSNLIIGRRYLSDPSKISLLKNPNKKLVDEEVRINLDDNTVKVLENPTGSDYYSYDKVNRILTQKISYEEFLSKWFKTQTWNIKCEKSSLDSKTNEASVSSGTAFFISNKGYLLTNNHVVEGCKSQKINYYNKEYEVKIIASDKMLDLALLKANVKPKSYISFSKDEPKKRQTITAAGYPLGQFLSDDLKINDGRISALKGFENNSNEIQHDIPINPGNSGGPIVNEKGQLVAIAVSGMAKDVTEGLNFGIKSSAVANFLKSNKISPSASYMNFSMDDDKLVRLLEESTVYTFCE